MKWAACPQFNLGYCGKLAFGKNRCWIVLLFLMTIVYISFSHVRIRLFKNVQGKCSACAFLSDLRDQSKEGVKSQYFSWLLQLHRVTYMRERQEYHKRYFLFSFPHWIKDNIELKPQRISHTTIFLWLPMEWRKVIVFCLGWRIFPLFRLHYHSIFKVWSCMVEASLSFERFTTWQMVLICKFILFYCRCKKSFPWSINCRTLYTIKSTEDRRIPQRLCTIFASY